ncbi:heme-binding protein [Cupriavidus sp. MP-37]|uniref:GlcG/HbpS family heme-binding protein n=1 Tax=Cupriavidus sp. MP-37 TaxID=2884455 RepID=UPI001D0A9114|nr:heme-binding protein [Cupriavidus sp. MP-37]UDM52368.1 heme-binding protein [Cupriavidus sp. MP-37]
MTTETSNANRLTLIGYQQASQILEAAIRLAQAHGTALSFVVVDSAGHPVAAARMDGAPFITMEVARGKAFACVATGGQSGRALRQRYVDHPMVWGNIASLGYGAPLLPAIGSLPIWIDGVLVGAVATSGGQAEVEEDTLIRAIESIGGTVTP